MKKVTGQSIDRLCRRLVRKYRTNDPFELACELNVHVEYDEMGTLKGYYCYMNRIRLIVINSKLDEPLRRMVCAHELGHDRLHWDMAAASPLCDTGFASQAKHEIQANRFAAGLLVPDEKFLEYTYRGYTNEQIARALGTYAELVDIKARCLYQSGMQLRLPDMPNSGFIKDLE